ncbi:MAG TPA: rhodanese-like domain-containing protein [Pseudomonadota bacterium]|nr:rhodanese-like domain-containing protein [Rhodanobacteraceae bacterium]MBP9153563.1 rhodanese-like domain-containing protein [Xanthomonadales bacterium]HQW81014.1 rhodanese-like domain-containing protein [Pseudomonadota bacterium]
MFGRLKSLFGIGAVAVSPQDAVKRINAGACVVDVREADEFAQGSIAYAVNVPLSRINRDGITALEQAGIAHAHGELLIVCRSGMRSGKACSRLQKHCGERALNLRGGLMAWAGAGLPISRG